MIYKTFDDWKKAGRAVRRGQKSHKRNEEGIAMFHKEQTDSNHRPIQDWEWDPDDMEYWSQFHHEY